MARQASPRTEAIRKLLTANPDITHSEARPKLKAMNIPIASEDNPEEFKAESNYFNVTKYNWGKKGTSKKPKGSANTRAKTAAKKARVVSPVVRMGRRPKGQSVDSPDLNTAIAVVREAGGLSAAAKKSDDMKAQIEKLQAEVATLDAQREVVASLTQELNAA